MPAHPRAALSAGAVALVLACTTACGTPDTAGPTTSSSAAATAITAPSATAMTSPSTTAPSSSKPDSPSGPVATPPHPPTLPTHSPRLLTDDGTLWRLESYAIGGPGGDQTRPAPSIDVPRMWLDTGTVHYDSRCIGGASDVLIEGSKVRVTNRHPETELGCDLAGQNVGLEMRAVFGGDWTYSLQGDQLTVISGGGKRLFFRATTDPIPTQAPVRSGPARPLPVPTGATAGDGS